MTRASYKRYGLWGLVGLATLFVPIPFLKICWSSGLSSTEYRLTFVDENGRPIPGVTLRVLTRSGGVCHLFPINEFLPGQAPTSDHAGRMVFYHDHAAFVLSGSERKNLLGMRFSETTGPNYDCVFSLADREVYRVRYGDLIFCDDPRSRDDHGPGVVKKACQWPDWPRQEYLAHHGDWPAHLFRLYDGDGDGRLDIDERHAAAYFDRVAERSLQFLEGREVEFHVVEGTITVSAP